MEGYTSKETIEEDIGRYISGTPLWRKKCIVTYRANGDRPFAYLRFPSIEATREAMQLFDDQICFGNQRFPNKRNKWRIHLECVRDETDLLSHQVSRRWNAKRYWLLTVSFLFLPITLTVQWMSLECTKWRNNRYSELFIENDNDLLSNKYKYCSPKELASIDLLGSLLCFSDELRIQLMNDNVLRFPLIMASYALYTIFYFLGRTIFYNGDDLEVVFTASLPMILYFVIGQFWSCWCSLRFEVAYPQFHGLEHVSMYFEDAVLFSRLHLLASDFAASRGWNEITFPWQYPLKWKKRMIVPALIYPLMSRLPPLLSSSNPNRFEFPNHTPFVSEENNGWDIAIEVLAAALMFWFCFILFSAFNTITLRTLSYWKEVHGITELITLKSDHWHSEMAHSAKFLRLDNETNLFSWLSLRAFIHRKGDVVFCGLEVHGLFLVIMVFFNLMMTVIVIIGEVEDGEIERVFMGSGFVLSQLWFLGVSIHYVLYVMLIGFWFGKENEDQLNRVERQKLFLLTERMKHLLNHEKYKLIDYGKVQDLKLLLSSMEALVQHVETKEITPKLWGIKMNDFKWKIVMTVIAAVLPSIAIRWLLNVN